MQSRRTRRLFRPPASTAPAEDISETPMQSKAAAKTVKSPCRFLKVSMKTLEKNIIRGEKYLWLTARRKTIFWYLVNETNLSKLFDEDGRQYIEVSEREIAFLSYIARHSNKRRVPFKERRSYQDIATKKWNSENLHHRFRISDKLEGQRGWKTPFGSPILLLTQRG